MKRKIRIMWSCSNTAKHQHTTKTGALLCGLWQQLLNRIRL